MSLYKIAKGRPKIRRENHGIGTIALVTYVSLRDAGKVE